MRVSAQTLTILAVHVQEIRFGNTDRGVKVHRTAHPVTSDSANVHLVSTAGPRLPRPSLIVDPRRCRGLRILVELLDEDYMENKSLILSSLAGIGSVFDLQVSFLTRISAR